MGEKGEKTPSTPSNEQRNERGKHCENCGATIDTADWYPVTKERDSDGTLRFYSFCSEACQDAWLDR